jgi:hypothetical protein
VSAVHILGVVQDAIVAIAIAASGVAVLIAAMVFHSMASSTFREIVQRVFPGASHKAVTADLSEHNELAHPPKQRAPITLRRVLWGVKQED